MSPEAQEWQKQLEEIKSENDDLSEREANLTVITDKADFYAAEAKRLENLLVELQKEREGLIQDRRSTEADYKGVVAENEVLVQEVISAKLLLVELMMYLVRRVCSYDTS